MATVGIVISQKGMEQVQAFFRGSDGIMKKMADIKVPLKLAGNRMLYSVNRNFRDSGRPEKWKPLARSTLLSKLMGGRSPLPLIRSGASGGLQGSITFRVTSNKLAIGTSVKYAAIHQYGGTTHPTVTKRMRGWAWHRFHETKDERYKAIALTKKTSLEVRIPKRKYLLFQEEDLKRIEDILVKHLSGGK